MTTFNAAAVVSKLALGAGLLIFCILVSMAGSGHHLIIPESFFVAQSELGSALQKQENFISTFVVKGHSMVPLFLEGQVISLHNFARQRGVADLPRDSAIVIHGQARTLLLKSVAAVPGDSFEVREGGHFQGSELLVNGKPWGLAEKSPRIFTPTLAASLKRLVSYFHGKIPPESILALGLSQDSYDSVSIGLISSEDILGVVR